MSQSDHVLDVIGLEVQYGGVHALAGISIHVKRNEIVALIGGNGAGKSTLLDAVSGLTRPAAGEIIFKGINLRQLPPHKRAHLGLARSFQDGRLFQGLTVRETLEMAARSHRRSKMLPASFGRWWQRRWETRGYVNGLIEDFGLGDWAESTISSLSTGTRRICDMAAQLATRPELMILDEPTAGVAQRETEEFGPLIKKVAGDSGCAILVVEHDMPMVLSVATRVYCLEAGCVIAEGTPDEILSNRAVISSYLGNDERAIRRSGPMQASHRGSSTA